MKAQSGGGQQVLKPFISDRGLRGRMQVTRRRSACGTIEGHSASNCPTSRRAEVAGETRAYAYEDGAGKIRKRLVPANGRF